MAEGRKESKGLTEIVFVLDRSGSMWNTAEDAVGGFNSLIEKERNGEGKCLVSTVLFNGDQQVLHDRIPIGAIPLLTMEDYAPGGCTALLDAVGGAIHHIGNVHKYAREEDRPERTLFCITTDGYENASVRYDYEKVKHMIDRQSEKYGWEFIFFGANIDAAKEAARFGIRRERSVQYSADRMGTRRNYDMMCEAVATIRGGESLDDGKWLLDDEEN